MGFTPLRGGLSGYDYQRVLLVIKIRLSEEEKKRF